MRAAATNGGSAKEPMVARGTDGPEYQPMSLLDFLATFHDAVLTSSSDDGELWSRPAALIGERGGEVLFGTKLTAEQRRGLHDSHPVSLAFQDRRRFLGVRGRARIVEDPACLDQAWPFLWRITVTSGKEEEELSLLSVRPEQAELWDPGARCRTQVAFG